MIAVTIDTNSGPITIATTYVPSRINYLHFPDYYKLFNLTHPSYLIADINCRHPSLGHGYSNNRGNNLNHLITTRKCFHIGPYFPTILSHNYTSAPDIVLKNNNAHHNINIQPGPLTPSDHIPLLITISTNPIQIPITPRPHYHKADWDRYKTELSSINLPTDDQLSLEEIDQHLDHWTQSIINTSKRTIPTLKYRTIPGIQPDQTTTDIQNQYIALKNNIIQQGPTYAKFRQLTILQHQLNNHYKNKYIDSWNTIISNMHIEPNPKTFWRSIKKLSGNSYRQYVPYLKHNNTLIHSTQHKEQLFREHWEQIFNGIDPPENDFDNEHIEESLHNNAANITPHHTSDLSRLHPTEFPLITESDIKNAIKRMKQKAPGPSGITCSNPA